MVCCYLNVQFQGQRVNCTAIPRTYDSGQRDGWDIYDIVRRYCPFPAAISQCDSTVSTSRSSLHFWKPRICFSATNRRSSLVDEFRWHNHGYGGFFGHEIVGQLTVFWPAIVDVIRHFRYYLTENTVRVYYKDQSSVNVYRNHLLLFVIFINTPCGHKANKTAVCSARYVMVGSELWTHPRTAWQHWNVVARPFHLPLQSKHASSRIIISCPILRHCDVTSHKNAQLCSRMYPSAKLLTLVRQNTPSGRSPRQTVLRNAFWKWKRVIFRNWTLRRLPFSFSKA